MPNRRHTRTALAALALVLLAAPAAAAEGYYDAYGNWVELPPRARYYRAPPVYAAPPEPGGPVIVYAEPPDYYDEAPLDPPPTGWGRRLLARPGEEVAVPPGYRLLRRGELPPEFRDDPRGLAIAPEDGIDPPAIRRLEERRRDRQVMRTPDPLDLPPPEDWGREDDWGREAEPAAPPRSGARVIPVEPSLDARSGDPGLGDGPAVITLPPARQTVNLSRALDALAVYAPAKKAAVKREDAAERNMAMKKANAWLVTASALPATPATIRALDKLLGIPVDKDSTALPGAGTSVEKPKAGKPADVSALADRLGAYAEARTRNGASPTLIFGEGGKKLDADEMAGLDLFLGIPDGGKVVAEKAAP